MALSSEQLERYARHIVLKDIGGAGQQKLLKARVLVVGAGGLGSPCLLYLAAAGVGTLGIIDNDDVSLSNLQRQIAHRTQDVGAPKVESAARAVGELNPGIKIVQHPERLSAANALAIISQYDVVADGCDNFATRFLVNDACYFARKPLVSAAVGPFEGQLATFKAYEKAADGNPLPNYRDFMPEAPPDDGPLCEQQGVMGALTGVMGSLQALEVIKEITGAGESLAGKLLIYDALQSRFRTLGLKWDPSNPLTGKNPTIKDLSAHS